MTNRRFEGIDIFAILLSLSIFGCGGGDNPVEVTVVTLERIAFRVEGDGNIEIYVMYADGSNQVNLTNNTAFDSEPAWSPDGSKIAFVSVVSERDGNIEIYVMDADGSNQVNLTNNVASDDNIAWSPDGSKIAFLSSRDGNGEIYVMEADGSNQVRLTNTANNFNPVWSLVM